MKLEQVKSRLQSKFVREPTLVKWVEAVKVSYQILQSQVHSNTSNCERLIYAKFCMVVYIAKQYQGRGIGLQNLMQHAGTVNA